MIRLRKRNENGRIGQVAAVCLAFALGAGGCLVSPAYVAFASADKSVTEKASSTSLDDAKKEKKALEAELAAAKKTIQSLKESKEGVEDRVAELNTQLLNISARITTLENQLTEKNNEIVSAKEQLSEAKEHLAQTEDELEASKERQRQQYADMKIRIQYMYENSQTNYLQMLLESGSISEFLNAAEYIAEIEKYDRQKLTEYQETVEFVAKMVEEIAAQVENIADMEAQLQQDYDDLAAMKADVEAEKASVAALMNQKETELAGLSDEISDTQDDIDYYEAEIQAQEELIAEIKRLEAEKAAAGKTDQPYSGGAFTWPCPSSTRITSDFGPRESPTSGASTNHKGIDIGAAYGADIVAAADGTVKAATYSSACGNYVMIDHGGGLYTVYMHASSLCVSVGDVVAAGDVIAKVGSTGISTGNHLHFGVSLNGSYVSPWSYFG
ncbi:MAG: murein hydrolase activator EnvC family protein [Roseburia sp.]